MLKNGEGRARQAERTRESIAKGVLPPGLSLRRILHDLQITRGPNCFEVFGFLSARHFKRGALHDDLGLVSCRLVTSAFVNYLVDAMQDSTTYPMDVFAYHASGTGTNAESNTDTALQTEVETRGAAGTKVEGATGNIYKSVKTITYTTTRSITEHGVFSAATAGTLLDRSVFTAVPVENTDTIEFTYQLVVTPET